MAVDYDEIEGSPKIVGDRRGGSATRMFKIAQADRDTFFDELFPDITSGYGPVSSVPGRSWLVAIRATAEPWDESGMDGASEAVNEYTSGGWKFTVEYGIPTDDQQQQSAGDGTGQSRGDGSGPGGNEKGSTGGETGTTDNPVVMISHEVSIGGEFLVLPDYGLIWVNASDGKGHPNPTPEEIARFFAVTDSSAGITIPIIEHQVTWHYCLRPPWLNIRKLVGRVNDDNFCGAPAETLLFLGCEASREITNEGVKAWTLKYKFSEKNYSNNQANPEGWNFFFRANKEGLPGGGFERMKRYDALAIIDCTPVYETGDFTALFNDSTSPY